MSLQPLQFMINLRLLLILSCLSMLLRLVFLCLMHQHPSFFILFFSDIDFNNFFLKVCAYKDGEVIIDTAAGVLGNYDPRPVQPDSLFPVFSVTKAITAGMLHWLVDNGCVIEFYECQRFIFSNQMIQILFVYFYINN